MLYHVIIEASERDGRKSSALELAELDKQELSDIMSNVVIPYLRKSELHFDGYFLKPNDIRRLLVRCTEKPSEELANDENARMPAGVFMIVRRKDVVQSDRHGKDVTKELLQKGREILTAQSSHAATLSEATAITNSQQSGFSQFGPTLARSYVRKLLSSVLKTPSAFDAFCMDFFPSVFAQFSNGMDSIGKMNLLLLENLETIYDHLIREYPTDVDEYERRP